MQDFEKLGLLYLGKIVDPETNALTQDYLVYDAKDLVTHAVCVGMTGSGKTGLCITLLEEAAIDKIPSIIIDPKGDMGNLLLAFPDLRPEDFRPWIREEEAAPKGVSPEEYARSQAELWGAALAEWGQDGERVRRLKSSADFAIYTPGSSAGLSVSIMKSLSAPAQRSAGSTELIRERIQTTTSGLLGLLRLDADPLRSREHILISNLIEQAWKSGKDLDLGSLIQMIQSPSMSMVGIFDLEYFYPAAERSKLALALNNLLAAPGFSAWLEGEPLDIGRMLYTSQGKPRVSIFSIGHLSDAERMFFVTLLLNQVIGWMREQPGTTSLRALLYMDEVFGFLPPVSEPPSKRLLLTLLKQARAFGVGVVLATQNPVDLDYKGMSNAGTWFIGRLQTERDKERLVEGISGASSSASSALDRGRIARMIAGLGKRVFLMHNVHRAEPKLFQTRWALSYLPGPLTREQIGNLMRTRKVAHDMTESVALPTEVKVPASGAPVPAGSRPLLPPEIRQYFAPTEGRPATPGCVVYHPYLFAAGRVHLINNKYGIAQTQAVSHVQPLEEETVGILWDQAIPFSAQPEDLARQTPEAGASYLPMPRGVGQAKRFQSWQKAYLDFLYRQGQVTLWKSGLFKLISQPGESELEFRIRLQQLARERRDIELDRLRQQYSVKMNSLQNRLMRAGQRIQREQEQYGEQKVQTAISVGATLLGTILGRKALSAGTLGRATTAARGASRISREKEDIERAEQERDAVVKQIAELEAQVRQRTEQIAKSLDPQRESLQQVTVRPAKGDLMVQGFGLLWIPYWQDQAGNSEPLFPFSRQNSS